MFRNLAAGGAGFFAASGVGGPSHLAAELFDSLAGVKLSQIPYKGAARALTDMGFYCRPARLVQS